MWALIQITLMIPLGIVLLYAFVIFMEGPRRSSWSRIAWIGFVWNLGLCIPAGLVTYFLDAPAKLNFIFIVPLVPLFTSLIVMLRHPNERAWLVALFTNGGLPLVVYCGFFLWCTFGGGSSTQNIHHSECTLMLLLALPFIFIFWSVGGLVGWGIGLLIRKARMQSK